MEHIFFQITIHIKEMLLFQLAILQDMKLEIHL